MISGLFFGTAFGIAGLAAVPLLDVALATQPTADQAPSQGRLVAARYFFHYELPKIGAWLQVVRTRDQTCASLPEAAF